MKRIREDNKLTEGQKDHLIDKIKKQNEIKD